MPKYSELDIEETLTKLSRPDKIALLSGTDFWHTYAVDSLGIPRVRMSDGRECYFKIGKNDSQLRVVYPPRYSKRHQR